MHVSSNKNIWLDIQTNNLIKNKEILLKEKDIEKLKISFRKILVTKELLNNFRLIGILIGLIIACIFLILIYFLKNGKTVFFVFTIVCVALAIIIFLGYCGSKISKKKKIIVIEKIIDYVFKKLVKWTFSRLNLTEKDDFYKRRYLIENLMNCFSHFVQFKKINFKNDFQRSIFESIFSDKDNIQAIKISLKLFGILFKENKLYKKNAIILFKNIYMPIVYMNINEEISYLINIEKDKFETDTKIKISLEDNFKKNDLYNFFEMNFKKDLLNKNLNKNINDQEKNESFFNKSSKVIIDRNIFNKNDLVFNLFQDLWKISHIYKLYDWELLKFGSNNSLQKKISEKNLENNNKSNSDPKSPNPDPKSPNPALKDLPKKETTIKKEEILPKPQAKHSKILQNLLDVKSLPTSQFKTIMSKKNISIYKKIDPKDPIILVKSITTIPHAPIHVFNLLYNLNLRKKWDKILSKWSIKKKIDKNTDIVYSYIKAPFIVTDREFLQKRVFYKNIFIENQKFDFIIAFGNFFSEEFPVGKNVIRADTKVSGYVIREVLVGEGKGTELTMISKTDIKGLIPKSLVNHHAKKKPVSWAMSFEKTLDRYVRNGCVL